MKTFHLLGVVLALFLTACGKKAELYAPTHDYLIFGTYFGMCLGDCTTLIKIENGDAYLDDVQFPFLKKGDPTKSFLYAPRDYIDFEGHPLPASYFNTARSLLEEFPSELARLKSQEFGLPDGDDRGGIYLEVRLDGERKIWTIDRSKDADLPDVVLQFRQRLKEVSRSLADIGKLETNPLP